MEEPSFGGLLLVAAIAFCAPLVLGLAPGFRLPAIVLEIVLGIVVGPSVLGWVELDAAVEVLSLIGLAFLLFLAGLEIEFEHLRGRALRLAGGGWLLSFAIAVVVGLLLGAAGLVDTPLLVAVILCATSLGVIIPILKDAGEISSPFGQLVVAAGSIADFGAIVLLSIFFTGEGGLGATLLLLAGLFLLAVVVYLAVRGAERSRAIMRDLTRLQDTTAQIRVRGAVLLLVAFAAVAETLGLEVILGTFIAGAVLTLVDRDEFMTHPQFRRKLEAIGYGVFIPVFFVASGIRFDLEALTASVTNLAMVPVFLAALVVVRGLPAILYRRFVGGRRALVAGIFQSTSLPFIVAATAIGAELGLIGAAESAALVGAGLLSVLIFPLAGLTLLRRVAGPARDAATTSGAPRAAPGGIAMGPREDAPAVSG